MSELARWLRSWTAKENAERGTRRRIERFHRWAAEVEVLEAQLARCREALRLSLRRKGSYRHLPFCPGILPNHHCWAECERGRAALRASGEGP